VLEGGERKIRARLAAIRCDINVCANNVFTGISDRYNRPSGYAPTRARVVWQPDAGSDRSLTLSEASLQRKGIEAPRVRLEAKHAVAAIEPLAASPDLVTFPLDGLAAVQSIRFALWRRNDPRR
jgi:hypothetical protein